MNRSRNIIVLTVAGLMLALSFGSGALAASMITGKQIKNGTVTTKDVKNRTLKVKDFSSRTRTKLTGPQGPKGDSGLPGLPGVSGFQVVDDVQSVPALVLTNPGTLTYPVSCTGGRTAIAAAGGFLSASPVDLTSQVTRVDADTFSVSGVNLTGTVRQLALSVTCADVTNP